MAAAECPLIGCIASHPHRPKKDRWEYQGNTLTAKFSMYRISATSKVTLPLKIKKKKKEFQSYRQSSRLAGLCVCGCTLRVLSSWCHLYFLSLPDTAIWASVCSNSLHLHPFPSIYLSLSGTHTLTVSTPSVWGGMDRYQKTHTHILYHPEPAGETILS